ncbi:MAG: hypothetical protein LBR74_07765 [Eubacterium sp.]|jgi:arginine repressor|nr:hypothetical protein [Eubacterium sp.]
MDLNSNATRRVLTAWGIEVKKRLIETNRKQTDLVKELSSQGFDVNKIRISNWLYGIGASTRTDEIKAINKLLGIEIINY